jgi:putative oxygen-independent coproporphyrinogen III oxidase
LLIKEKMSSSQDQHAHEVQDQQRGLGRGFGWYVHVPYCATRCGYCDFNTYALGTAVEVSGAGAPEQWADAAIAEVGLARRVLGDDTPAADTVFFGGGTPTLLPVPELARVLDAVCNAFGCTDDAEITTEANPESVTPASLRALRDAGFTRLSLGMQSATPGVLATLDRHHTPGRVADVVGWAREAGFGQVSLDLIYGTPGETVAQWRDTVSAALSLAPDHVSAYSLIVEPGTRLAAQVARGDLPAPDDDDLADKYVVADDLLAASGFTWYEVSNWARTPESQCRHNLGYWRGADWWGIGPGAHSHVDGTRWWNVKHPARWAARLADGESPEADREVLDAEQRRVEDVLLRVRLAEGLPVDRLSSSGRAAAAGLVDVGLVDAEQWASGRVVVTRRGRLLADAVVRDLLPD